MPTKKRPSKKRSSTFFYTLVGLFALSIATYFGVQHSQNPTQAVAGITAPTPTSALSTCVGLGDINNDGKINGTDVALTQRISVGLPKSTGENYTAEEKRRADVNRNGVVSGQDIILIQRKSVGLDAFFLNCAPTSTPTPTLRYATPTKKLLPTPTKGGPTPTAFKR